MSSTRRVGIAALLRRSAMLMAIPCLYVLSCGPVLGLAFRLREATGNDAFYLALWFYYPLLAGGHNHPIKSYIEWWVVDVFHTVGPG